MQDPRVDSGRVIQVGPKIQYGVGKIYRTRSPRSIEDHEYESLFIWARHEGKPKESEMSSSGYPMQRGQFGSRQLRHRWLTNLGNAVVRNRCAYTV